VGLDGDEAAFRLRVRGFLAAHCLPIDAPPPGGEPGSADRVAETRAFQRALAEAGLAGLTVPVALGGAGLTRRHQELFDAEAAAYRLPTGILTITLGMCLPLLLQFGNSEQQTAHVPRMVTGADIWCQMFSEPGAGSDVASLQTRAVPDGDEWVLDGQKVWTSGAHYASYGLCLARTDPAVPKHRGISMFVVPTDAPGVEVRPLRQANGSAGFNEVFLTAARIPAGNLVGAPHQGWQLAVAMLMYERSALGTGGSGPMTTSRFERILAEARSARRTADPVVRQGLVDLWVREQVLRYLGLRIGAAGAAGRTPGPEGSVAKLLATATAHRARDLSLGVRGPAGQAWLPGDTDAEGWASDAVGSMGLGIAGGTSEVQRTIMGERVLGLPKEPAVDRDVPFRDLLVGTQRRPPA
jgi:alkylation response protein AidB-like acyl-CoA dehydrogenase